VQARQAKLQRAHTLSPSPTLSTATSGWPLQGGDDSGESGFCCTCVAHHSHPVSPGAIHLTSQPPQQDVEASSVRPAAEEQAPIEPLRRCQAWTHEHPRRQQQITREREARARPRTQLTAHLGRAATPSQAAAGPRPVTRCPSPAAAAARGPDPARQRQQQHCQAPARRQRLRCGAWRRHQRWMGPLAELVILLLVMPGPGRCLLLTCRCWTAASAACC
jgi:hypothetical protein